MQRFFLKTANGELQYNIISRKRVRKRLHMEVSESGDLVVVAPVHWSERQVADTLEQNRSKVVRFLSKALQQRVQPLEYRQGELHLYQGIRYPLMINITTGKKNPVIHTAHEFIVNTHSAKPAKVEALLQAWYQRQAFIVFDERLKTVAARADWVGERQVPLKLRRMKRTWGNCSSSGVIKLNTHLIKAPVSVIDSVIAHELCHLVEMNHGRDFYRLLAQLNPGWKQDREQLRSEGRKYLL